jgi:hypothetical protein
LIHADPRHESQHRLIEIKKPLPSYDFPIGEKETGHQQYHQERAKSYQQFLLDKEKRQNQNGNHRP